MCTIYKLANPFREYSWGSKTAFSALFNKQEPSEKPQAEMWMGAHPSAPSSAIIAGRRVSLFDLIKEKPLEILGSAAVRRFGNTLPFLFKILAAEKPLSIQAHPDRAQAETGFTREETAGIPIESPERVYRDRNHKPELICALTPFWALIGFRSFSEIAKTFALLKSKVLSSAIDSFYKNKSETGLKTLFCSIMDLPKASQLELIEDAYKLATSNIVRDTRFKWMASVQEEFPADIGILGFLFLNIVELKPLEALFLPVRKLHSYLSGIGIEIMANSDNVVRGGLTEKYISVSELTSILGFSPSPPEIIRSKPASQYEAIYASDAKEFALSRITLSKQEYRPAPGIRNVEIIVAIDGNGSITDYSNNSSIKLERGDSCLIPAAVKDYRIEGKITIFKATVPVSETTSKA